MRIAIISDIHANLPAFEEVMKNIDRQDIDMIFCLGDLVGYNVWPNAIINEMRKRRIAVISGNHDVKAVEMGSEKQSQNPADLAYFIISKDSLKYLSSLPTHIRLEFECKNKKLILLLVHGSPNSNSEYLLEDKPEQEYANIFIEHKANVIVCGHSHKPYHRIISNHQNVGRVFHAINAGSVGKPKDGKPQACYAIITIDPDVKILDKGNIKVEFVRVNYDIEKAAQAIEDSDMPNEFADMLRNAY